jgi:hypothetical protein
MNDTIDHLQRATLRLSQEGSMKDRLIEAYTEHLADLEPSRLPECMRADFQSLHKAMHSALPQPRECVIRASVRKMSIAEVRTYAALVVRAFAALARGDVGSATQHRATRSGTAASVVALYAEA